LALVLVTATQGDLAADDTSVGIGPYHSIARPTAVVCLPRTCLCAEPI